MEGHTSQVRVLTLNKGESTEATLFRLEKGWTLHFILGPSLAAEYVRIFTNHPKESRHGPQRHQFRELAWQNLTGRKSDVYDNFAEVPMVLCGSFNYFFTLGGSDKKSLANGTGNFLVDPMLKVGRYDERLPLDSICCQTVLSKSLGAFSEWPDRLRIAKESGYNMIHFTPIQELGESNSAYCLKDQFKLNPAFNMTHQDYSMEDVGKLVNYMKNEWEILSITDLVYNHSANESPWIQEHPECGYNMVNSPHLKPAYLLDRILWHFSIEVSQGKWEEMGVPPSVSTEVHLNTIRNLLMDRILPKHHIPEYFLVHIDDTIQNFRTAILSGRHGDDREGYDLYVIPDPKYRRLKAIVDMPLALHLCYTQQPSCMSEDERINAACGSLRGKLDDLNNRKYKEIQAHLNKAVDNFIANARWRFVDPSGERLPKVHEKAPLMWNYFSLPNKKMTVEAEEAMMNSPEGAYCMAHNGWVMNDDPLRNFAEPGSNIYLRRELIPWGDSVKLRYGAKPADCPYLWEHMKKYTEETARIFHGVRLDNCHSTPIHVAEYMLDAARTVRPDLYVIAELFTSSEYKDNIFINRLGLNSLIRESLCAWNCPELGRLVHRYGGHPVGAFIQPPARPLVHSMAHAIFFDQTHDNDSPIEKRPALDVLPSAAVVAMASCAIGSNRGYDELVPHHINVVTEDRLYKSFGSDSKPGITNASTGIIQIKKELNNLHQLLGNAGFNQVFVGQVSPDIVAVTRHNPVSHQSVVLVSRTAFSQPNSMETGFISPVNVPGVLEEIILEASVEEDKSSAYAKDPDYINGLPNYKVYMQTSCNVENSNMVKLTKTLEGQVLDFVNFGPGSIIAYKINLKPDIKSALLNVRQCLSKFGYRMRTISGRNIKEISSTGLENIIARLTLNDINRVLFHCDTEERDDGKGFGHYNIPGYGDLPYCGLQGVMSILSCIRSGNDLGHPLCNNLRQGDWMMAYTANRLKAFPGTHKLGEWMETVFANLSKVPRYLIPCYFDAIVTGVFMLVEEVAWAKMNEFVRNGSSFVRALSLGSVQFCSPVKSSPLPIMSSKLARDTPDFGDEQDEAKPTLAAGFPHFASGIFRCWGRDTFISLRGLLLITNRHQEARSIIIAVAGCLRHGLIPNLLGDGTNSRYNCRDAVWWWLQCVQYYCQMVPDGHKILQDTVMRLYPTDDVAALTTTEHEETLQDTIQEALQRHADGVKYRERNAGPAVDNDMSDEGFNVEIGVNWDTGFVFGGNSSNCGTWMDKMGSSDKAGNKGKPATPRDGSAVELVGLSASTLHWLSEMSEKGLYKYNSINATVNGKCTQLTFTEWYDKILENFEKCFWIDLNPAESGDRCPDLIHRRGIYKDSYGASQPWTDYQLRSNVPVTMVMAPELFRPDRAWTALSVMEEHLLGPLGMKTLDPSDWSYSGDYINSDDSSNYKTANGFNYHQGPEWLWPIGYFLRAKLHFAKQLDSERPGILQETLTFVKSRLSNFNVHIQFSSWRSLPELTNSDGQVCLDSCSAQAWSVASILEVLFDMENY